MIEWATELVNNLPDDEIRTEQSFSTIADFFRDYPDAPMLAGIQQCRLKKIELPDDLANETPRGLFQLRVLHAIVLAGLDYMKAQAAALAARQDMPTPTPPQPHELREELADEPFAATGFSGR